MITDQHREEQLSRAYIQAVVAHAGHIFIPSSTLDYGVDGTLRYVIGAKGKRHDSGICIDVQLKSTTNWTIQDEFIVYDVEVKTFNDLASRFQDNRATQMIGVLLCLPEDEVDWLSVTQEQLTLKKCCYWFKIDGPNTENTSSKRIFIPKTNVLSPETVESLLKKVKQGENI